jgi:hypothetical protein
MSGEANVPLMSLVCVTTGPIPIGQLLESGLFHLINKKRVTDGHDKREQRRKENCSSMEKQSVQVSK